LRLDFKKIGTAPKSVKIEREGVRLEGELSRREGNLTDFKGKLSNNIEVQCSRCGQEFDLPVDEDVFLKFSDGLYRGSDPEADVIEFFDGKIDLDAVLNSEIESIRLDYHICPACKKGEEDGST